MKTKPKIFSSVGISEWSVEPIPLNQKEIGEGRLQDLLEKDPDLLPVTELRQEAGPLICIGREVQINGLKIDNLYLSAAGYPVIAETKLWRNPQARREVLSQTLDYIKEIANTDFEWFCKQWESYCKRLGIPKSNLADVFSSLLEDEVSEDEYHDRVNQAIDRGDILAMIVGDGIQTQLQDLVAHLCRNSSHWRYSIALVEMNLFKIRHGDSVGTLVIPQTVQNIVPVGRAHVRVTITDSLGKSVVDSIKHKIVIESEVEDSEKGGNGYLRSSLGENEFLDNIESNAGGKCRDEIKKFYEDLTSSFDLEPALKAAALMIKVPQPDGDGIGASILGIEKKGRIYNTQFMIGQLKRWGIDTETATKLAKDFWAKLNEIDSRFNLDGISHLAPPKFIPFVELVDRLPQIKDAIGEVVSRIRATYEQGLEKSQSND